MIEKGTFEGSGSGFYIKITSPCLDYTVKKNWQTRPESSRSGNPTWTLF